jgi:shikimate 5-dehydrogenase
VWDRNTKGEEVEWADALKLAMGAGGVATGVAYAVGTDGAEAAVETVTAAAQDMFVGKPGF